jgi:hypothetical protein
MIYAPTLAGGDEFPMNSWRDSENFSIRHSGEQGQEEEGPEDDLVAGVATRVSEAFSCYRDKLPTVRSGTEVELENTGRTYLHDLESRGLAAVDFSATRRAPGPHHKLTDTVSRDYFAFRGYRAVALVAVGVPRENYVSTSRVEHGPKRLHLGCVGTGAGGIEGVVEVGQGTSRRVAGEVPPQPASLGRTPTAAAHLLAVAVEGHYVPASTPVAVVASAFSPRPSSEVLEVARCARSVVVMVARSGLRALLVLSPGGSVTLSKLRSGAVGVDIVAKGVDGSPYSAQQPRRGAVCRVVAAGDVPRANQRYARRPLR